MCVFVRVFTILDATGLHFYKTSYRHWKIVMQQQA